MNDYSRHEQHAEAAPTREALKAWLAQPTDIGAGRDAGFSDDGESATGAPTRVLKPASVLILIVAETPAPAVLFTQRTPHLTDHGGQISFPGGRVEATDRDAVHTALREAAEETGVAEALVEVLGTLPCYTTGTGYLITPVVGWCASPPSYQPDPTEVAECFHVPLAFLLDHANHRIESAMYKGRMRDYCAVPYRDRYIWGATAGMLVTFASVVSRARGADIGIIRRGPPDSA